MPANSNSLVLDQDLRAAAQDYKRDSEHKHKWELGEAVGPGRTPTHPRPRKPEPKRKLQKGMAAKGIHRQSIVADRTETITDSSEEDVEEPSAAPAPDSGITYSFDASRGPNQGSQILGLALERAVEQFESNATDKLVQDEYEILNSDGEPMPAKTKKARKSSASGQEEEEEYEFV